MRLGTLHGVRVSKVAAMLFDQSAIVGVRQRSGHG